MNMQRDATKNITTRCQHNSQMHIKHHHIGRSSVAILLCLLVSGIAKTNAVPTDSVGIGRAPRDVSVVEKPKDVASAETIAADQPKGQCLFDGVLVDETSVSCVKQVGCRAIQKTGHCCPDYKCDCEKDGKTYSNGDKLVDPETPCTVCYCQGGEILCSSVTCFIRDDCKPKYVPGRCCPEYDNCPVSILDSNNGHNHTSLLPQPSPTVAEQSNKPEIPPELLNPKITIKEITKPIEIRITDDNKAIPIHQMLKPSTTTTTTSSTTTTTSTEAPAHAASTVSIQTADPDSTTMLLPIGVASTSTSTTVDESNESSLPLGVSAEHNPPQAAFPAWGINNESLKLTASVAYPVSVPAPAELPKAEGSIEASAERALEEKPLPAFGSQGLQQVDAEGAQDPTKVNIKRENLAGIEVVPGANTSNGEELSSSELIYAQPSAVPSEGDQQQQQHQTTSDLEPDTAGSDNIYHIILTTAGPNADGSTSGLDGFRSSTEAIEAAPSTVILQKVPAAPPVPSSPKTLINAENPAPKAQPSVPSTTPRSPTTVGVPAPSSTDHSKHSTDGASHGEEEEAAIPVEANPAYPSLPEDDFSLRDVNFPLSETDDASESEVKDESRSIGGAFDAQKHAKHASTPSVEGSGDGSGAGMLIESVVSSTTAKIPSANPSSTETVPGKIALLINSAEDLSAETTISNSTDFQHEKLTSANDNESGSGVDTLETQSLEALIGEGSGSGELSAMEAVKKGMKEREPTTPRPARHTAAELDIDELGSASGDGKAGPLEDPKEDAESLKLDENQAEGVVQQDKATQTDVVAVKTNGAEEKALEESNVPVAVQRLFMQRFI